MTNARGTGIYRALFYGYPSRFRQEYGADMALLFEDQLRDEPAARVWARALVDLAITVPTQHLEAHMNRPPTPIVPAFFGAISIAGILVAVVSGVRGGSAAVALAIALGFGALAVAAWWRTRAITTGSGSAAAHWWKFVAAGGGLFATTLVVANVVGEAPDGWWLPMMLSFLLGILVFLTGLFLGMGRLAARHANPA